MTMNATNLFSLIGLTAPDARKWSLIRNFRNLLLNSCDWTQIADAPLTLEEKEAWSIYRQALRDIPENYLTPDEVIFPTAPDGGL
jgi:hypothetical protein